MALPSWMPGSRPETRESGSRLKPWPASVRGGASFANTRRLGFFPLPPRCPLLDVGLAADARLCGIGRAGDRGVSPRIIAGSARVVLDCDSRMLELVARGAVTDERGSSGGSIDASAVVDSRLPADTGKASGASRLCGLVASCR